MSLDQNSIIEILDDYLVWEEKKAEKKYDQLSSKEKDELRLKYDNDAKYYVYLYKHFANIKAVVHTHSTNTVAWAQAGRFLPVYGTTHANTFYSEVPITRHLTNEEVTESYEWNTGKVIVEAFENQNLDPSAIPTVLVNGHGPFTWGTTTQKAIENSLVLDECCQMAQMTESVRSNAEKIPQHVLDKYYYRNHGANAYYGQN